MPTAAQADALAALLDTRTPLVVIETHEEKRLLALAGKQTAVLSRNKSGTLTAEASICSKPRLKLC